MPKGKSHPLAQMHPTSPTSKKFPFPCSYSNESSPARSRSLYMGRSEKEDLHASHALVHSPLSVRR